MIGKLTVSVTVATDKEIDMTTIVETLACAFWTLLLLVVAVLLSCDVLGVCDEVESIEVTETILEAVLVDSDAVFELGAGPSTVTVTIAVLVKVIVPVGFLCRVRVCVLLEPSELGVPVVEVPIPEKVLILNDVLLSVVEEIKDESVLEDCLLLVDVWKVVAPLGGGVTITSVLVDALTEFIPMLVPVPLSRVLTKTEVRNDLSDSTGRADAEDVAEVVTAPVVEPPIGMIVF